MPNSSGNGITEKSCFDMPVDLCEAKWPGKFRANVTVEGDDVYPDVGSLGHLGEMEQLVIHDLVVAHLAQKHAFVKKHNERWGIVALQNLLTFQSVAYLVLIFEDLAGIPGLSLPCGLTRSGLPIGLQLLAPAFAEETLLQTARVFERATDWHTRRPGIN